MTWVFDHHFPQDPVMPGTMLIEGLLQLAGFFGAYVGGRGKGRAARIDDVKFLAEVTPEDREISYRIDVRKHNADHTLLVAEGKVLARGTERTRVGSLFVVVLKEAKEHH
jgi:3-hydroxyacyl-[acyl-carrier protein] dehydratase/trans-2-decenoyl-[acyl-carrier protein] isomerase